MASTYTYIARSADDPRRAAILTLHGHRVSIEPAAAPGYYLMAERMGGRQGTFGRFRRMMPWMMPAGISAMERLLHQDFRVSDLMVRTKDEGLSVSAWVRLGGLRLLPVTMTWNRVDNPDAAQAFVQEVDRRRRQAGAHRGLPGPLDYWASWLAGGMATVSTAAWMVVRAREASRATRSAGLRGWMARLRR
ncbi:MAG TPA: hypothetical protein GX714_14430 [Chloroflexi bacterium]|jgi:hypothetical protein|nr:hypothetical protein [Chloroflexota bacterium]